MSLNRKLDLKNVNLFYRVCNKLQMISRNNYYNFLLDAVLIICQVLKIII